MSDTKPTLLLSNASPRDFAAEALRRVQDWLASLPDGKRWSGVDWVFATVVTILALGSTGLFTTTSRILADDPDYFFRRLVASLETRGLDLIETGAIAPAAASGGEGGEPMPVPTIVRATEVKPADYQIVMIFDGEVLLATSRELMRATVGSVLPGLGAMLSLDAQASEVRFENAVLRTAP